LLSNRELYEKLYGARDVYHPVKGKLKRYGDSDIRDDWFIETLKGIVPDCNASVIDVGCGRGRLMRKMRDIGLRVAGTEIVFLDDHGDIPVRHYEMSELYLLREKFDVVVCCDVLEHLDPDELPIALANLWGLSRKWILLSVGVRPARNYPTAMNLGVDDLHKIVKPAEWWRERFSFFMDIVNTGPVDCQSYFVYGTKRDHGSA
jgi:SAM-dependent methyltransferase